MLLNSFRHDYSRYFKMQIVRYFKI
ncbi:hypothetical protein DMW15_25660, partial [Vibrio parahaemolyticus]|nr:hypothetical protein [Vibrio parahaemolyticus]